MYFLKSLYLIGSEQICHKEMPSVPFFAVFCTFFLMKILQDLGKYCFSLS